MKISKEKTKHFEKELAIKAKKEKSKLQRKARKERADAGIHLQPNTIESMSVYKTGVVDKEDSNVQELLEQDELYNIINQHEEPKVLITSSIKSTPRLNGFCQELSSVIPKSEFFYRHNLEIKKVIKQAKDKEYTSVIVISEDDKVINSMKIYCLPNGPAACFRLSSVTLRSEHKNTKNATEVENVKPQVALLNFKTMMGLRLSRILLSLFPVRNALDAHEHQRNVTFKNQRDFIFFRHYRHKKRDTAPGKVERMALNEIGPRFTMRLEYLHKDLLNNNADYEYLYDRRENMSNRRQFVN